MSFASCSPMRPVAASSSFDEIGGAKLSISRKQTVPRFKDASPVSRFSVSR